MRLAVLLQHATTERQRSQNQQQQAQGDTPQGSSVQGRSKGRLGGWKCWAIHKRGGSWNGGSPSHHGFQWWIRCENCLMTWMIWGSHHFRKPSFFRRAMTWLSWFLMFWLKMTVFMCVSPSLNFDPARISMFVWRVPKKCPNMSKFTRPDVHSNGTCPALHISHSCINNIFDLVLFNFSFRERERERVHRPEMAIKTSLMVLNRELLSAFSSHFPGSSPVSHVSSQFCPSFPGSSGRTSSNWPVCVHAAALWASSKSQIRMALLSAVEIGAYARKGVEPWANVGE